MNLKLLIISDFERRYGCKYNTRKMICEFILSPVFRLICLYRICHEFISPSKSKDILNRILALKPIKNVLKVWYKMEQIHTGIQISEKVIIGRSFSIEHFSGIVIGSAVIGDNCTVFHGVTIGYAGRENGGGPIIGNNCVLASGAKIVGNINIGNNVFIGANAVVAKNIPDNAVVGAPLGTIISYKGTKGYFGN